MPRSSPLAAAWARQHTPVPVERLADDAPLTDHERDVLDFEARTWARGGEKLAAIRDTFGWSETRYYQVLLSLLERPAALQHAPQLVHRLRAHLETGRPGRGPALP